MMGYHKITVLVERMAQSVIGNSGLHTVNTVVMKEETCTLFAAAIMVVHFTQWYYVSDSLSADISSGSYIDACTK